MWLVQVFNKPHPFIYNWKSIVIPGVVTLLVILLFAPFGYGTLNLTYRFAFGFLNGLIASLNVWGIVKLYKKIFPGFMQEEKWSVGKEFVLVLSVLFSIICCIFLIFVISGLSDQPITTLFVSIVIKTVLIGAIPVLVLIVIDQNTHHQKKLQQALKLTKKLRSTAQLTESSTHKIKLDAENQKTELILNPEQIYFLKSDGNYVEVYYDSGINKIEKKLIRNRLKSLEEPLPKHLFFHCHKSYVINLEKIIRVDGNARNLELVLRNIKERVPVSRQKRQELESLIQNL
ncbi:LytR/AlgR family response regulator transcription factor [Aquimarina brevivitae]|uniref:LytTR family transcriptional regulator n=1 Tax=Aquimarina brevivitae TaxID=323412 RepID=A0A4Q7NYE4_9FLAO|nr:LytTR family DNA-binding domain-containing protein [Aquimarina brevivitae]RZS92461.1 LytTR family transcriptional regulator [Aquimarina brevivitae]